MAFDQNSIPKDQRPLNVTRAIPDESRIATHSSTIPAATTITPGIRNPEYFAGPEGSFPVVYPASVADAGFVGLGYGNPTQGIAQWAPVLPMSVGNVGLSVPAAGFAYSPNLGARAVGNAVENTGNEMVGRVGGNPNLGNRVNGSGNGELTSSGFGSNPSSVNRGSGFDHGTEEGGDDSVSGKKVKFLCSFGGKIMPRPSDSKLRYVGGQTRIISVRKDASFNELQQKMVDTYGQPVVIKYQLPDEDLDALVSVSCPDDLDNMMEEYEKLVERSSDGSAKLRVFLFSAAELDASGMLQFGDLHEGGHRYVDAVNGMIDGPGGLARKESMTSATSTQNSDFSGIEGADNPSPGQAEVTGTPSTSMLYAGGNSATSQDTTSKLISVDYSNASAISSPVVNSAPSQTLSPQSEVGIDRSIPVTLQQQQMGYDFQQSGIAMTSPAPNSQAYVDPWQETTNHAEFMRLPPVMGFPRNQMLGATGSMFTHQRVHDNNMGVTHQFIPSMNMTMTPSSHVTMQSHVVQPLMQPLGQQTRLEHYPDQNAFGTRIVHLPVDPSYNAYQAQFQPAVVGGGYGWRQAPQPENVVFSDGPVTHQPVVSRLEDCYMCQKALPHVHSDSVVQEQRESVASPVSENLQHSLRVEDTMKAQAMNRVMATGALGESNIEQVISRPAVVSHVDNQVRMLQSEGIAFSKNVEALHEHERIAEQSKPSICHGLMGLPGEVPYPYGMFTAGVLQSCSEDSAQHHPVPAQYQVKHDALLGKPLNSDASPVAGLPNQASECLVHDSSKEYSGTLPFVVSKEDRLNPCVSYEQLKPIDGMMETLRISPREPNFTNELKRLPVDELKKDDILDHGTRQFAVGELPLDHRPQFVLNSNQIKQTEVLPAFTEPAYLPNSLPVDSYEVMVQQPAVGNPGPYPQSNFGTHLLDSGEVSYGNSASSLSPALGRVGTVQDTSNSLFSDQDPWNLRHDTHFPPRPNKLAIRKEAFGTKDPFGEDHFGNAGELVQDVLLEESGLSNLNNDFSSEQAQPSKGSPDELIKQELQAVAEGVAASVLKSATSISDSAVHEGTQSVNEANQYSDIAIKDVDEQHKAKFEDMKRKMPERVNFGLAVSEDIGRLQIIKNSDLEELRELGSGTFGTVYHGKWRGTDVAIKRINDRCFSGKPSEQERMINDFWNEAIKLADLHHPNVVAFYGVVLDGPGGSVATVTEFMVNGSLRNSLQKNERSLDIRKRLLIAMDVAFGMEYLHGKNVVHFDLKSDNLLVNLRDPHRPICKVGDLGLSKVKCQTLISGGVRGTLPWMAPELLNGSSNLVSDKVDVFSFGIVLWELLTGEEPYADLYYGAIIGGIVSNTLRPEVPESCDPDWKSLMERCWSAEPSERPSFTGIANELRAMAAKIPPKGQNPSQQQPPASQVQK